MTSDYDALKILANAFGIEPQYTDNQGKIHRTDTVTARKILEVKGVHFDTHRMNLNPQVLVVSTDDFPSHFSMYLEGWPDDTLIDAPLGTVIMRESLDRITEQKYSLDSGEISISVDDEKGLLHLSLPFPSDIETGIYRLEAKTCLGEKTYHSDLLWIVCPEKCYQPPPFQTGSRIAGISIALYGVRSERNWGVGDFFDLKNIVDWARDELKVDFVGINPLHALFNKRPFNNSPYLPSSRFYRNFIYLDIIGMEDFKESPKAQALVALPETQKRIQRLQNEEHVNYEEIADLKISLLQELFRTFLENHGKSHRHHHRWTEFETYRVSEGIYIERYATFCALQDHFQGELPEAHTWRQWPVAFHSPSGPAVKKFQIENEEKILFWIYVQWQIDIQLQSVQERAIQKGMLIGLYHDEALAVDRNGADFWGWQDYFHDGFSVGAPPDAFAPEGQDWGFPPPDRERIRRSGYEPFLKILQVNCRHGGALRIDHVMQLNHLFWIPMGKKASEGVFVKDYESDLLSLMCLESERGRTLIVGEDLGTVPFNYRERLMSKGILSYRLFYFERDQHENQLPFRDYPQSALVSISTHDLPTLAGFWSYRDIDLRREMGQVDTQQEKALQEERRLHKAKIIERLVTDGFLPAQTAHAAWESPVPTEDLHTAVLSFIFHTPSKLALINQEDLFLDIRQQNFPGTTSEHPNWVTKMRFSLEDLRSNPEATRLAEKFRRLAEDSGRGLP